MKMKKLGIAIIGVGLLGSQVVMAEEGIVDNGSKNVLSFAFENSLGGVYETLSLTEMEKTEGGFGPLGAGAGLLGYTGYVYLTGQEWSPSSAAAWAIGGATGGIASTVIGGAARGAFGSQFAGAAGTALGGMTGASLDYFWSNPSTSGSNSNFGNQNSSGLGSPCYSCYQSSYYP